MKNLSLIIMGTTLALGAPAVMAGSMLCGGTVIQDGDPEPLTEGQVLAA